VILTCGRGSQLLEMSVERGRMERNGGVLTLLLTIARGQNNAWPVIGSAIALVNCSKL
jgi:hypothetical protein